MDSQQDIPDHYAADVREADVDQRIGAALAELSGALKAPTERELIAKLGAAEYAALSPRQCADLGFKVMAVRAARPVARLVGWRQRDAALTGLTAVLRDRFGRDVRLAQLRHWRRVYRLAGPRALIDRRGRRRGNAPVDAAMLVAFAESVARGFSQREAHARVLRRAEREGLRWPRAFASVRRMLSEGIARVKTQPAPKGPEREYRTRGLSGN